MRHVQEILQQPAEEEGHKIAIGKEEIGLKRQ